MTETVEAKSPEMDLEVKTSNMETHSALPPEETERLSNDIVAALKTVFDPEIPADIYELGLIYKVELKDDRSVDLVMTLTTLLQTTQNARDRRGAHVEVRREPTRSGGRVLGGRGDEAHRLAVGVVRRTHGCESSSELRLGTTKRIDLVD